MKGIIVKSEGPYKNRWSQNMTALKITLVTGDPDIWWTHGVDQRPQQGIMHPSRRDARSYLRDNGFILNP